MRSQRIPDERLTGYVMWYGRSSNIENERLISEEREREKEREEKQEEKDR